MHTGLLHLHNLLRWVILILLVVALIRHLAGMAGKRPFSRGTAKTGLFLMIAAHIQLLIGLYQWFFGPVGLRLIQSMGMGAAMKDPVSRFWTMEHNLGMLTAIILITIGRGIAKKPVSDLRKHSMSFWLYLIALILILAVIPWPGREGIGRPLLPGM